MGFVFKQNSFTIIEIIMVMVLIGFAASMAMPKLITFMHAWDLEIEMRKITANLRYVQQKSITGGLCMYGLKFDPANQCYDIQESCVSAFSDIDMEPCNFKIENNIDLLTPTDWEPDNYLIYFKQFGAPQNGGVLMLQDTEGRIGRITIEDATGRVYSE